MLPEKAEKQAAEATAAELQKSLQQERDKTEAMARDLATVRRTMARPRHGWDARRTAISPR